MDCQVRYKHDEQPDTDIETEVRQKSSSSLTRSGRIEAEARAGLNMVQPTTVAVQLYQMALLILNQRQKMRKTGV